MAKARQTGETTSYAVHFECSPRTLMTIKERLTRP